MIKKIFFIFTLLAFMGCEAEQTRTFKGQLFFSISDNFEEGISTETYELKESDSGQLRKIIFKDGAPPENLQSGPGSTVVFEGTLLKDGSILYLGPATAP